MAQSSSSGGFLFEMKLDSRYSRSFYSDGLTDRKYREIYALALSIQEVKNELSKLVNQNLFHYLEMSKHQFQTEMLPLVKNRISSNFVNQLLCDVYIAYQNKFKNIKHRLKFQHIKEYNFTYYKRSGKNKSGRIYKAGDFKGISIKHDETPLSITLTYLARYGYFGIVDYLLEKFVNENNMTYIDATKEFVDENGYLVGSSDDLHLFEEEDNKKILDVVKSVIEKSNK